MTKVVNDFKEFQKVLKKATIELLKYPNKRVVLSAKRTVLNNKFKEQFSITYTDDKNVHFYNIDDLVAGKYAVLASPDFPSIEEDKDETLI